MWDQNCRDGECEADLAFCKNVHVLNYVAIMVKIGTLT